MNAEARKTLQGADLSSAFAKPSRAAGLRLPPPKPAKKAAARTRPSAPVERPEPTEAQETPQIGAEGLQEPSPAAVESPAVAVPERSSVRKAGAASAPSRPAAGQGRLVLWTPIAIRARMKAVQDKAGKPTYLDQVLDALEATVDELPELVAKANGPAPVQGRLFERTVTTPAESNDGRVQLTIRGVLDSQLAIIDQLVEDSGAPSRSALCNAALDAYLPTTR